MAISTRFFAAAYLLRGDDILLLKRAATHKLFPGVWAPIGGHIEPQEINNPQAACLREIEEETSITPEQISALTLRYITIRIKGTEIRQQFLFFGHTTCSVFGPCIEGELHFVPLSDLLDRELSIVNRMTLEHYLQVGQYVSDIYVGTVYEDNKLPQISWCKLEDWGEWPV